MELYKEVFVVSGEATKVKRRYAAINIHMPDEDPIGLGMVRIRGSLDATAAVNIVCKKLTEFGVDMDKDVVATTTDGASVMVKFGKLLKRPHQQCHSHGLHLAVIDVLYKTIPVATEDGDISMEDDSDSSSDESVDEDDTIEIDSETSDEEGDDSGPEESESEDESTHVVTEPMEILDDYGPIVDQIRKICRKINKSPLKCDLLEEYLKKDRENESGMEFNVI